MRFAFAFVVSGCATAAPAGAPPSAPPPAAAAAPTTAQAVTPPPPTPEASVPVVDENPRFGWVLPLDHGIRNDKGGQGAFLAPRYHGQHNGVDLLAPLGTAVLAPCAGEARAGHNSSHGKWLHLICALPRELGLDPGARVSLFFAHLSSVTVDESEAHAVKLGERVGAVGKTGNASGAAVAPHLHFEAIVQDSSDAALAERHSGRDQSETEAGRALAGEFARGCLAETGLGRKEGELWRARRVDPFVLLICLGAEKPAYSRPSGKLAEASYPWSTSYTATSFDVDTVSLGAPSEQAHAQK